MSALIIGNMVLDGERRPILDIEHRLMIHAALVALTTTFETADKTNMPETLGILMTRLQSMSQPIPDLYSACVLAMVARSPGQAVLMASAYAALCARLGRRASDHDIEDELGLEWPTEENLRQAWQRQKFGSSNLLDDREFWPEPRR